MNYPWHVGTGCAQSLDAEDIHGIPLNMADSYRIHMISDSTGETIAAALRATVAMFGDIRVHYRRHVMIRSESTLNQALDVIAREPGLVVHTVVETELRTLLERRCHQIGVPAIAFLDPVVSILTEYFGRKAELRPGAQHSVDERYYRRVSALDFALASDDGSLGRRLAEADVVLIGVSRTSKTPTCVYLAGRGIKAANVPLILGKEPPSELLALDGTSPLVVGLTAKPTRLAQIRQNRLTALQHGSGEGYADIEHVRRDVIEAMRLMERLGCPVIDVTRRSIEETAAEIYRLLDAREPEVRG